MKYSKLWLASIGLFIIAAACSGRTTSEIEIQDAWIRATSAQSVMEAPQMDQSDMSGSGGMENKSGSNSAAYLVIQNNSSQPDRLLNAYSELALSTEIHVSEDNNGVMSMRPVDGVDVPARGKVELKPGSYHIMLVNISRDLIPGEILKLTLEFQSAGKIEVQADVRAP